ncbi:RING finger protein 122-like [Dreissena polymorpha]|uniref:RING-type domain-containing protein n=1 Tax=Dreissena polymorpha TaxID=45954 RepID=A0A9D4IUW0_DREPO|nr:RING finger protein 122-like [Dreissena polymorpha]XP_052228041.1 RING finger protein 122-like [Dreissena polymorpha]XP_052228042.1 RING finger protein 122-like [Dreissena polymorpha]XP_052228043.1 RING finger protein 122-like [Dreissena polymorpha]XP_052228044.1 RING finger protein 122-like [Dreissena polymorpha]XP_052228045.1 RING finger protein 122-like [Dreissena polymorpha]XP_052228046.1 RING finger protein 122-like [Dreissena polymorpha]XP_052228047.1 RING finger protein 122-like [D
MDFPGKISLPLFGIGLFMVMISLALCCYMWKLKRGALKERGYKNIAFSPKKKNIRNDTCPVCLDEFKVKENIAICSCQHQFHFNCLVKWLHHKNSCPMCTAPVRKVTHQAMTPSARVVPVESSSLFVAVQVPTSGVNINNNNLDAI